LEHIGRIRLPADLEPEIPAAFQAGIDQAAEWLARNILYFIGIQTHSGLLGVILHALQHQDEQVKVAALGALHYFKDQADLIPLIGDPLGSSRVKIRMAALCTLHSLAGPAHRLEYLEHYRAALADSDRDIRSNVMYLLRDMGEPSTFDMLVRALSDPYDEVRRLACVTLGELDNPAAIPALKRLFEDEGKYVARDARQAVEKLKKKAAGQEPLQ
jgi:hypothetical protein